VARDHHHRHPCAFRQATQFVGSSSSQRRNTLIPSHAISSFGYSPVSASGTAFTVPSAEAATDKEIGLDEQYGISRQCAAPAVHLSPLRLPSTTFDQPTVGLLFRGVFTSNLKVKQLTAVEAHRSYVPEPAILACLWLGSSSFRIASCGCRGTVLSGS